jgi:hypothetical protein
MIEKSGYSLKLFFLGDHSIQRLAFHEFFSAMVLVPHWSLALAIPGWFVYI